MKIKIVNLWIPTDDFFNLDILGFSWVDCQLVFVILNISFIIEY